MAQQPQHQYEFQYQRVELLKTEELGVGSYGAVCKAICDDLPCAAKILHPALFQFTAPGATSVMQNFEQECRLLSAIKHPHIVQYLGTYRDPESRLTVLLMELMDESLTRFLEQSHKPLPYHTEVNLCHDIVLALSYLHSNGIIHRDLSSNNVLLIAGSRAKVTDFGMAKLYDVNRSTAHLTPLTLCPGTMAYMSPEALRDRPVYSDKLDSFSFGVLCIQIMTRQYPDPGDRFNFIEINDPRAPSGTVQVEVPEYERRQSHIDLIDPAHPLLPVALDCLKSRDRERPSCHELCGRMSTLKASPKYTESVQQSQLNSQNADRERRERESQQTQQIQDLQQQLHTQSDQVHTLRDQLLEKEQQLDALCVQVHIKDDQLQGKEQRNQQQQQQILRLQAQLTAKDDQLQTLQQCKEEQLAGKDHQLQQKEAAIVAHQQEIQQLTQQLQSSEQLTAEFQQNLLEREKTIRDQQRQIQELQQQLKVRDSQRREEKVSGIAAKRSSIKLRWRAGGRAPCEMRGQSTAVDGCVAYFRPADSNSVFAYNFTDKEWSQLPKCPNYGFSLAVVNSFLTAIGGKTPDRKVTNSLLSLTDNIWIEQFPPMPTKRWLTAVVCSGKSLVVAGGEREYKKMNTVEVMDVEVLQWSTASSLPRSLSLATATLCGDQVYVLGGHNQSRRSKSVFTCSLAALLQSCQLQSQVKTSSLAEVWNQLADTPVISSTCASLHGQLLAVGGWDSDGKMTTTIYMYNPPTNSWEVISHMATPRFHCLVAAYLHNKLMVVGGGIPTVWATDSVEIATIV